MDKQAIASIRDACQEYIDWLRNGEYHADRANDYENAIFEAAIEACFGSDIWDEINTHIMVGDDAN